MERKKDNEMNSTSVGNILRGKREAQGIPVEQFAEKLCITPSYLRAIEADDVQSLPGAFFYKSFALQYAAILEIDPELLRADLDATCAPKTVEPASPETAPHIELTMQLASRTSFFRGRRSVGAALTLAMCSSAGFAVWRNQAQAAQAARAPQKVEIPAEPAPSVVLEPAALVAPDQAAVLSLAAREVTWLSITSEGKEIFEGVLWPRQSKTLTGLDQALLKVGNAGGLDVSWNGKSIGPIGEPGEVRVVVFSADDFHVLPVGRTL